MASSDRFGYEWNRYSGLDPAYEAQFANWVKPLTSADFKNKIVLDVGCGMGRNSYWSLKWGASKVVAFDADNRSVAAAKKNLAEFLNAEVLFKSVYEINWNQEFDIVFSIGVIHHLEQPAQALKNMVSALKLGGKLVMWVYSYEGNEWIVKYVDPIRKNITSRLPVSFVHYLSYLCSVPLWLFVKSGLGKSDYLKQLAKFKFWHIHSIVFDQLLPTVANYWKRSEVESLLSGLGLKNYDIHSPPNGSGWIVIGTK